MSLSLSLSVPMVSLPRPSMSNDPNAVMYCSLDVREYFWNVLDYRLIITILVTPLLSSIRFGRNGTSGDACGGSQSAETDVTRRRCIVGISAGLGHVFRCSTWCLPRVAWLTHLPLPFVSCKHQKQVHKTLAILVVVRERLRFDFGNHSCLTDIPLSKLNCLIDAVN